MKCEAEGMGLSGGNVAVVRGSWCRTAVGVSTNIMLGPGVSSLATAVRGTGFEENLGRDSGSWMRGGARDELERWNVELAALLAFLLR